MHVIESQLASVGVGVSVCVPAHSDWRLDRGFATALGRSRLMLVNGEGSLHHDRPAGLRLLESARHARSAGLRTVLVNAGWESNGAEYAAAASEFDLIAARDSWSAREIRAAGLDCVVVPDFSLLSTAPAAMARQGVGVTDSVDLAVARDLEQLRRELKAMPVSIHDVDPERAGRAGFLRAIVHRGSLREPGATLAQLRARNTQWQASAPGLAAFLRRIGGLELLVSGRFHACTLALVAGTPFVAAGTNTHKIRAMIADSGIGSWRGDAVPGAASVRSALERGWSDAERIAVAAYVERAHREIPALFTRVRQLIA